MSREKLGEILSGFNIALGTEITPGVFTAELPHASLEGVPRALELLRPIVPQAEPDGIGFAAASMPDDPFFSNQWNLLNTGQSGGMPGVDIGAPSFWSALPALPDVTVAVLDTGVDFSHPDLRHLQRRGFDFVNQDADPSDDNGHGTGVAGVIFAARNNGTGTSGLLSGARLLAVKVLGSDNKGSTADLIEGLSYARTNGASVINMSLVGYPPPGRDGLLAQELARCEAAEIILCVSAGNRGSDNDKSPDYPSSHTNANIIAVGNHERLGRRWDGPDKPSNFGQTNVDLFAPGAAILSTDLPRSYGNISSWVGTSVATPHVAATAAALRALRPLWSAADIKAAILESAVRSPALAGLCQTGGRLNAARAADYALQRPLRSQKIPAFAPIKDTRFRTTSVLTNTTTSAGLPVSFSVVSGPARVSGNRLSVIGVGKVVLAARQPGNTEFNAAPALSTSFNAVKARQTIQFTLPSSRPFVANGRLALNAANSAKLPVTYTSSNPRVIAITGQAPKLVAVIKGRGTVRITAAQPGNNNYLPARAVVRTITIK
jgi:subtilisin family serine protease